MLNYSNLLVVKERSGIVSAELTIWLLFLFLVLLVHIWRHNWRLILVLVILIFHRISFFFQTIFTWFNNSFENIRISIFKIKLRVLSFAFISFTDFIDHFSNILFFNRQWKFLVYVNIFNYWTTIITIVARFWIISSAPIILIMIIVHYKL